MTGALAAAEVKVENYLDPLVPSSARDGARGD
jgi:hypothetical protein